MSSAGVLYVSLKNMKLSLTITSMIILAAIFAVGDLNQIFADSMPRIINHLLLFIGALGFIIGSTLDPNRSEQTRDYSICVFLMGVALEHWSGVFALVGYILAKHYINKLG